MFALDQLWVFLQLFGHSIKKEHFRVHIFSLHNSIKKNKFGLLNFFGIWMLAVCKYVVIPNILLIDIIPKICCNQLKVSSRILKISMFTIWMKWSKKHKIRIMCCQKLETVGMFWFPKYSVQKWRKSEIVENQCTRI